MFAPWQYIVEIWVVGEGLDHLEPDIRRLY